jgi:phosphoribosyl-AMP cyclohydrolase
LSGRFPAPPASRQALEEGETLAPRFDAAGLVTAIVTDSTSGEVLMLAHMNAEALDLTISTGTAHYYSRSRARLWKKGETSGALQRVVEMRVDCDQDALWLKVEVSKPEDTCHTRRRTCFYRRIETGASPRLVTDI